MVLKGIFGIIVLSEALASLIIIMINPFAVPVMSLDAKVVVGLYCEPGVAVTALKAGLGHNYTGRNAILVHLPYCNVAVLLDILFSGNFACQCH